LDFEANLKDGIAVDWPIRYADIAPWYSYVEKHVGISGEALGLPHLPDSEFLKPMDMYCVEKEVRKRIEKNFPGRHMTIGRVANLSEAKQAQLVGLHVSIATNVAWAAHMAHISVRNPVPYRPRRRRVY
jgi:choline dehydrogenase-like flavoprotein